MPGVANKSYAAHCRKRARLMAARQAFLAAVRLASAALASYFLHHDVTQSWHIKTLRELSTAAGCDIAARRRTLIALVLAANLPRNSVSTLALATTVL